MAALVALTGSALADGVASRNTVGYQTYSFATADDYMHNIGVTFKNLGSADGSYTITTNLFDTALQDGDALLIFNPAAYNYDYYTFYTDVDGNGTKAFGVMFGDLVSDDAIVYSITINKGDNVLFMPAGGNDAVVSGEVQASGTATVTFTPDDVNLGIIPIANPFPIETKMSDLTFLQDGDALLIFNPAAYNYDFYTYYSDIDGNGTSGFGIMWGDLVSEDSVVTDPNTVILAAGQGGLYMPGGDRTWTVTLNY
ncbi:MAG: hypothetical protein IKR48_05045 [Kiritimatiellae bacterium]|nr:hypothetical protein [Kiritimatiellia bacterium]